jgi:hypothetical protein
MFNDPLKLRGLKFRKRLISALVVGSATYFLWHIDSQVSLWEQKRQVIVSQTPYLEVDKNYSHHDFKILSITIFLVSGISWTVPSDCAKVLTVECIAAGGTASAGQAGNPGVGGGGGGGGAWAKGVNFAVTPSGSITIQVGTAGGTTASDTFWNATSLANAVANGNTISVAAQHGGTTTTNAGGAAGLAASSVGTATNNGNTGGVGGATSATAGGGGAGGGGAGGLNGAGLAGAVGSGGSAGTGGNGGAGGAGDNSIGGAGGTLGTGGPGGNAGGPGGVGQPGTEYDSNHGSGGGGGGGGGGGAAGGNGGTGASAGNYGAGGGAGGGAGTAGPSPGGGGAGAPGLIVITYLPIYFTMAEQDQWADITRVVKITGY